MKQAVKTFGAAAVACSLLAGCSSTPPTNSQSLVVNTPPSGSQIEQSVKAQVAMMLEAFTPIAGQALPNQSVLEAYEFRGYEPLWVNKDSVDMSIYKFVDMLEQSASHGLNPVHYHVSTIKQYLDLRAPSSQQLAELDVIATIALSSYAHDLSIGRYEPQLIDPNWRLDAPNKDWKNLLFLDTPSDMVNTLPNIAPRQPEYQVLQNWLVYYQELAQKEGDIRVSAGVPLRLGDEGERVAQLRARLVQLGDIRFSTRKVNEDYFDNDLKAALVRFQKRHDLYADGAAGANTIRALNVSLETRAKQIAYNLERWRWLPAQLEDDRVWVDLTDYTAHIHLNDQTESMKVVIGKPERKTNVFYGRMTYMVTNPTWRVPMRIARENLLPKLQRNPNYLAQHGYKVYDSWSIGAKALDPSSIDWNAIEPEELSYRFEQAADDDNALGAYKFMFPNKFDIYLHDTPAKHLFREHRRAYSSGCIRLERPAHFADLLVANDNKRRAELNKARQSQATKVVSLSQSLPVYLVYFTVVPNANGMPEFREDIYERDPLMAEAMDYLRFKPSESI
ncbi:L,D-transpeptidase family protein [Marinomonas ostreistagni]|uniref:L,D-transpeptidase family protein n=1 Tax=Marinomonas ostreistagni TaxID=359209 RepID=UPI00194DD568|nr:L,D-transpeptidase family protein [Marinomonas ostreistagni]MBM6549835.1 L,D-transpeptidase family protein [Marinomonas ostreistagni]